MEFVRGYARVHFRRFLGDVCREFMQRLSAVLHGTLGSYLRDILQEGSVAIVAYPLVHGLRYFLLPHFTLLWCWWILLLFLNCAF
jgi:hypothetical protein